MSWKLIIICITESKNDMFLNEQRGLTYYLSMLPLVLRKQGLFQVLSGFHTELEIRTPSAVVTMQCRAHR